MEKSYDHGRTYHDWQYFAQDCVKSFGMLNNGIIKEPNSVNCIKYARYIMCFIFYFVTSKGLRILLTKYYIFNVGREEIFPKYTHCIAFAVPSESRGSSMVTVGGCMFDFSLE